MWVGDGVRCYGFGQKYIFLAAAGREGYHNAVSAATSVLLI
jgi:hypothetical protein